MKTNDSEGLQPYVGIIFGNPEAELRKQFQKPRRLLPKKDEINILRRNFKKGNDP